MSSTFTAVCSRPGPRPPVTRALVLHRTSPTTLRAVGELDLATGPLLAAALLDHRIERLDLDGVTFVDAAGIGVLVDALGGGARTLVLGTPSATVHRMVDLCDLTASFPIAS
jgi:anti-anti-sigma factor